MPFYYSHVEFLEKLALQLIWPEVCYDKTRDYVTQVSANTTSTRATNRNETGETETRNAAADKARVFNRRVQTLTERAFSTCFPKRLDGKFHPCIPASVPKPCQYCQCKERLSNPEAGKKIPDARRHRTDGGNLVHPIKKCKRTCDNVSRCLVCNVELCPQ